MCIARPARRSAYLPMRPTHLHPGDPSEGTLPGALLPPGSARGPARLEAITPTTPACARGAG
eukprot:410896-Alexandrium_andersonii.AAC.1